MLINVGADEEGSTHQAGGEGGIGLAQVERVHANQVGGL